VKLAKSIFFGKVSIPQSDDLIDIELSCQVACYPPVCKVHKHDVQRLQILKCLWINLAYNGLHLVEHLVHTWLHICIVILYFVDQFAQTPKYISFSGKIALRIHFLKVSFIYLMVNWCFWVYLSCCYNLLLLLRINTFRFKNSTFCVLTLILNYWANENKNKRSSKIVYALDVSAGWMTHWPDKKNAN